MENYRVVIVGSGRVAEAFARTLARCRGVELVQLHSRNEERGRQVASIGCTKWNNDVAALQAADIYIIAVSDRAVADVAAGLRVPDDAIVVHTAGSVPMEAIPQRGGRRGIIYPLQTFSVGREILLDDVPLFIEADCEDVRAELERFASLVSTRVEYATSERRRVIHLAGVFVNNFVNHLYGIGAEVLEREGLNFDLLRPLIKETAAKAIASGEPFKVQTGPAVRGDRAVIEKHLEMLHGEELKEKIYNDITESIWEISRRM